MCLLFHKNNYTDLNQESPKYFFTVTAAPGIETNQKWNLELMSRVSLNIVIRGSSLQAFSKRYSSMAENTLQLRETIIRIFHNSATER